MAEPTVIEIVARADLSAVQYADGEQGRGYASAVLRTVAAQIALDGAPYDVGALSPSDPAFYARLGWELWGGPLSVRLPEGDIATPDEEIMVLRLKATDDLDVTQPLATNWREGDVW